MALLAACGPVLASMEVSGDHRLLGAFVEDGAIVKKGWLEAAARYSRFAGGRDVTGTITAAFRFGRDVEAGLVLGVLDRTRDAGSNLFGAPLTTPVDGTGFADAQIYAKYRVLRSPFEMAIGATTTIPMADEGRALGPGTAQSSAFVGLRKSFSAATLVWSLGVAGHDDSRAPGGAEGHETGQFGAGLLVPLSYEWIFLGEINYRGSAYGRDGNDLRALAGLDWRPADNVVLRGGLGAGLSDAAPDLSATLSAAFHF